MLIINRALSYIGVAAGKKWFDPLLILYVCPLTKKWSVYNFNGRFISERQNNNKNIQKNKFQKSYKLICILMSQVFDPFAKHDLALGGKTLVADHGGQTFHLRRDFVPLLFADPLQVIKVSKLTFGNSNLQLPPQIYFEIKVWTLARPLQDLNVILLEPLLCCLGRVFWVIVLLEYPSTTHFQCPDDTWPRPSSLWCGAVVLSP